MERSTSHQDPVPPFPAPSSQTFDLSPLEFILALFGVIMIPTCIYTFFLFIKCPTRQNSPRELEGSSDDGSIDKQISDVIEYKKETHVKDVGGECPVCLSSFADGEEVRLLALCKHSFHASCINLWLNSHSNCPICRASVGIKGSGNRKRLARDNDEDFRQGLPDSSSLV